MAAIQALQQWCRQQCEGYRDVTISNMTTSFRDGLAFCAILHRHRPDLINYDTLRKENVYENNHLAFRVAEEELGIPALLDAEDMVALKVPDRLSVLTYVSQYYNYFHGRSPIGGLAGVKRRSWDSEPQPSVKKTPAAPAGPPPGPTRGSLSPVSTNATVLRKEAAQAPTLKTGESLCGVCRQHVHLVQRHLADGQLYHRSCFRCKQCSNTLRPGAYRATGEPGVFVCSSHAASPPQGPPPPNIPGRPGRLRAEGPVQGSVPVHAALPTTHRQASPTAQVPSTGPPVPGPPASQVPRASGSPEVPRGPISSGTAPQAWPCSSAGSPGPMAPAWTTSASKTQQARERFLKAPPSGAPPSRDPAALGDSGREQARSFLQKALPGAGSPGRPSLAMPAAPAPHPRTPGPHARPLAEPRPTDPQPTSPPARPETLASPSVGTPQRASTPCQAGRGRSASSGASGVKTGVPQLRGPAEDLLDGPAGWRARLRPVDKSPGQRAVEQKEPSRVGKAPQKASGRPEGGVHSTLTPVRPTGTSPPLGPGPSSPAGSPCPRRRLAVSPSLDLSTDWLQPSPSRPPGSTGVPREERPQLPSSPGRASSPHSMSVTLPVRVSDGEGGPAQAQQGNTDWLTTACPQLHPNYLPPEEIQRQMQDIARQLDALEQRGVELEKKLRAAEGDASEDALMVDWFWLIHEKQQLLRLESELMYKAKDQQLEEQQLDLQEELRRLMARPEALKSPQDRRREQDLLDQYVSTVNDRSEIVDFLEEDRLREQEEDEALQSTIQNLGLRRSNTGDKKKPKSRLSRLWSLKGRNSSPE